MSEQGPDVPGEKPSYGFKIIARREPFRVPQGHPLGVCDTRELVNAEELHLYVVNDWQAKLPAPPSLILGRYRATDGNHYRAMGVAFHTSLDMWMVLTCRLFLSEGSDLQVWPYDIFTGGAHSSLLDAETAVPEGSKIQAFTLVT
jgi:hypothetical protein